VTAAFARDRATETIELAGSEVVALDGPDVLWVVLEGEALVFATDANGHTPARPRKLVTALTVGSVATPVDGTSVGRRWLLVSPSGCVVAVVPIGALADGAEELAMGVQQWLAAAGLDGRGPERPGQSGGRGEPDAPGGDVAARLAAARTELARLEVDRLRGALAAEAELVEASEHAVDLAHEQALEYLGGVLDRRPARRVLTAGDDELLAVCEEVARSIGVSVHAAHPEDLLRATPIDAIAQASKLRSRRVRLGDRWWAESGESLIGCRTDGRPVALIARRRGYDLADVTTGERVAVDAETASGLRDDAVELIRPLPDGPMTIRSLIRFAGLGTGRDAVRLVVLSLAIGLAALVPPLATSLVFGEIVPQHQTQRLVALAAALVGIAFGSLVLQVGRAIALLRVRTRTDHAMQLAIWDRLLRLPASFFRRYQVGELTERSMVIIGIRDLVTGNVIVTLLGGVFGLFNLGVMIAIDVRLAAIGLLVTGAGTAVLFVIARAYRGLLGPVLRGKNEMTAAVHEMLNGIVKIRTAGAERRFFARWAERYARDARLAYKAYRIDDLRVVFEGAFPTAMALVLFATVVLIGRDAVPAAAFMGFYVALGALQTAVVNVARSTVILLEVGPLLEQARPILEEQAEADAGKDHPGRIRGAFALRQVSFAYPGATRPIFDGLSVSIDPGEFVAVVGPSGSGKSTLLRLVLGFERIDGGTVNIDGVDITSLDMDAVRRQIGVVLQQTALLPGSVFDNIAGSIPITEDEAWDAARRAGFDTDIERLPDGMATNIGDGVGILSGGQRQRLQIARALASRPRALLLDEATSALDNLTQSVVTRTVEQLDVTRIVIAHRLSTIASADRVVVIAGGRVVQDGPFAELAESPGPFADLIARQQL
jgi:ATP-binding cassette subfamily C protein